MSRFQFFLLTICVFLALVVLETDGKKKGRRRNKGGESEEEEEEEEDDHFECFNCTGTDCREAAEECYMCYTFTEIPANATKPVAASDGSESKTEEKVVKGCLDEDAAEKVEEDSCKSETRDGLKGEICYCKDKFCNSGSFTISSLISIVFPLFVILFLKSDH